MCVCASVYVYGYGTPVFQSRDKDEARKGELHEEARKRERKRERWGREKKEERHAKEVRKPKVEGYRREGKYIRNDMQAVIVEARVQERRSLLLLPLSPFLSVKSPPSAREKEGRFFLSLTLSLSLSLFLFSPGGRKETRGEREGGEGRGKTVRGRETETGRRREKERQPSMTFVRV